MRQSKYYSNFLGILRLALLSIFIVDAPAFAQAEKLDPMLARSWINEMKENDRGPFKQIRWFCKDGTVLPPTRTGCARHGGGIQHGELNERALRLRAAGYPLATLYAEFSGEEIGRILSSSRELTAMLLERYLIIKDEGWVFKKALFYRGALQAEDEAEGAERLLTSLLTDSALDAHSYLTVREGARLLALDRDSTILNEARADATRIANQHYGFINLRNKLHTFPEPTDAGRIRAFALSLDRRHKALKGPLQALSHKLERVFLPGNLTIQGNIIVQQLAPGALRDELRTAINKIENPRTTTIDFFWALSDVIYYIRRYLKTESSLTQRRRLLVFSLQAERTLFQKWTEIESARVLSTRYDHLQFLLPILQASYGCGILSERSYQAAAAAINKVSDKESVTLATYLRELRYLARVPDWSATEIAWEFHHGLNLMREIEPDIDSYVGDRLHSSVLLAFSRVLEKLIGDGSRLAGVRQRIMGHEVLSDVRALNPGIARGILTRYYDGMPLNDLASRIVMVEDTNATLPPVAGILTLREGNSLSHVQLLARSFGIPNAVVSENAIQTLNSYLGREIVVAISPAGLVEIDLPDSRWNKILSRDQAAANVRLEPDVDELDLDETDVLSLSKIDARDAGVVVGPKAANLGQLKKLFPDMVSNALVLPFGVFNDVLQREIEDDLTLFEWLQQRYRVLFRFPPSSPEFVAERDSIFSKVREQIARSRFDDELLEDLRARFTAELGDTERTGVFVRSDTNVEDLPGFTGAGLNLTEPNVVGFQNILAAIKRVWASPFTERAFSWRQLKMNKPEHVYPSVLLHKAVACDVSGVIVTSDLENGDRRFFTLAANRGVGGAVNNQKAESIIVNRNSGELRLLSEPSARSMTVLAEGGGTRELEISNRERLLSGKQVAAVSRLVDEVDKRYPKLVNSLGEPVPADIEFGFVGDKLYLFQIRPFLESERARKNGYLLQMDKSIGERSLLRVNLKASP